MDRSSRGRWRSAHDLLADNEKQEAEEWAKLAGDFGSVREWPPRWSRRVL